MTILDWLQAGDSSFAVMGGFIAVVFFAWRGRKAAIESNYKHLSLTWTNEGDINGGQTPYLHLALELRHGEVFGTLTSPQFEQEFEVHVTPGWLSSKAQVSLFRGRSSTPVAEVALKITGNKNRLQWQVLRQVNEPTLPSKTELWPSPLQNRNAA